MALTPLGEILIFDVQSMWAHVVPLVDILSMKLFVWTLGKLFAGAVDANGGVLDSLFFYDPYQTRTTTRAWVACAVSSANSPEPQRRQFKRRAEITSLL